MEPTGARCWSLVARAGLARSPSLARKLTGLIVFATASREQTRDWVKGLGAQHVIDYSQPFALQLKAAGFAGVDIVLALTGTQRNAAQILEVISPLGRLGLIEGVDLAAGL